MEGGPERVKCHSKRSLSRGAAWREGSGLVDNSVASLRMRRMVGDLVLNVGADIVLEEVTFTFVSARRTISIPCTLYVGSLSNLITKHV